MAVIRCSLQDVQRTAEVGPDGLFEYTEIYSVRTDNARDDARVVLDGMITAGPDPGPDYLANYVRSGGPLDGTPDLSAFALRFRPVQGTKSAATHWTVEVNYAPLPEGWLSDLGQVLYTESALTPGFNPLNRPARHWDTHRSITEVVERDAAGNPITNSAEQPWDEPAEEEIDLEQLNWEFRVATAGEVRALNRKFRRKLNADEFAGYPPEHCYVLPLRGSRPQYIAGVVFYTVTLSVLCADRPWRREYVSRGYKHLVDRVGGGEQLVTATDPIVDIDGNPDESTRVPVTEPVLLSAPPADATANVTNAVAPTDETVAVNTFSAIMPAGVAYSGPAIAEAINAARLTITAGTSVLMRYDGVRWNIVREAAAAPLPDAPPKRGYRLPEGVKGHVVAFRTRGITPFTGAGGLPVTAPT